MAMHYCEKSNDYYPFWLVMLLVLHNHHEYAQCFGHLGEQVMGCFKFMLCIHIYGTDIYATYDLCICIHVGVGGQPAVLFLRYTFVFSLIQLVCQLLNLVRKILILTQKLCSKLGWLAGPKDPLPSRCWDYKHSPPRLAIFLWFLEIEFRSLHARQVLY